MIENFDNKNLQSFEYETAIISDGNIVGTCELGKAEIQMLNNSNEYSSLKGQWIKTIHGSFYIYNVEPVQEKINIKLSCYDIKYKLDTLYDPNLYVFPMTLLEYRNKIADNCGISFGDSVFPNSDLILEKAPYVNSGASNREVIKMIAQASASNVITDNNDIFYFQWFEDTTYEISDWLELTTEKEETNKINVVVLGRGNSEDNVKYPNALPENPVEFRIDNNYILDPQEVSDETDRRYEVIEAIYNQVVNFSYIIFNIKTQEMTNKLNLKLGQKVSFKDIWGNELESYVMKRKISWLGGDPTEDSNYQIELSSEEIKETSTDYSYASSIQNDMLNVSRKADKAEGIIQDLVEKTIIVSNTVKYNGTLTLTNCNPTPLYKLVIKDACQIFPSKNLFPSETLYLKSSNLIIESEDGSVVTKYKLPSLALRVLDGIYDDLTIENEVIRLTQRIGVNEDENLYLLDTPVITELGKITLNLSEGTNKVYLESFPNAKMEATYLLKNEYTNTFTDKYHLISQINLSPEEIKILSNKIALEGYTTINGAFSVDLEGNASMNDATINGGDIILKDSQNKAKMLIVGEDNENIKTTYGSRYIKMINEYGYGWEAHNSNFNQLYLQSQNGDFIDVNNDNSRNYIQFRNSDKTERLDIFNSSSGNSITLEDYSNNIKLIISSQGSGDGNPYFKVSKGSAFSSISQNGVWSPSFNNNSLESKKKNIELDNGCLEQILESDICSFNWKHEDDDDQKHIGLIIADKGGNYKVAPKALTHDKDAIDLYSMTGMAWKGIQEMYTFFNDKIESLEKRIKESEEQNGIK